jgi:hypothetical protein
VVVVIWVAFTTKIFEFPTFYTVTPANMNYTSLLVGASTIFITVFRWGHGRKVYHGLTTEVALDYNSDRPDEPMIQKKDAMN